MKSLKFAVLGATVAAMAAVFLDWISVSGDLPSALEGTLPRSGMDNGGPVYLFLLSFPLIGAGVGALKRYGRGLAGLSFVGALLTVFMGLVKYADIDEAAREAGKIGANLGVATGYWLFFLGACAACIASLIALIKPEKKPEASALPAPGALRA
ncbi:MAG: hypothetical protein HOW73_35830 [Polyangiaceae bacterium]|nr:hypothetical protein [Polyangiaceae bacterium]